MDYAAVIQRFEAIAARDVPRSRHSHHFPGQSTVPGGSFAGYARLEAVQWLTEARAALEDVFPAQHGLRRQWADVLAQVAPSYWVDEHIFDGARAIVRSAADLLKQGHVRSFADGIGAADTADLLTQAEDLGDRDYFAAAAVIVGGALEMRLRQLCLYHGLTWTSPSIGAYNDAIKAAWESGAAKVYGKADWRQVQVWADLRNAAAHDPGSFTKTKGEMRRLIDEVRQFLGKL